MKPILQALVLADHVYSDVSGKKIIAGTFNRIVRKTIDLGALSLTLDPNTGKERMHVPGGSEMGCPWFYLSLTDVVGEASLIFQFVHRGDDEVLFEMPIKVQSKDRLATVEVIGVLPPIGRLLQKAGEYAFDVLCEGAVFGSHRVTLQVVNDAKETET